MEHLLLRLPGHRVLLADVHGSGGRGVGYGMMLIRMNRVLQVGRMLQLPIFFVPSAQALNTAVTQMQSDDVAIISAASWRGRWLTLLWRISAPVRIGNPWLWARRWIAGVVAGRLYEAVERSPRLPGARRFLIRRPDLYRRLKQVRTTYEVRSEALWRRVYKGQALARLHALEKQGQEPPAVRLRLPAEREQQAMRQAAELGITPQTPLVTVHVREAGYRATAGLRQRSWDDLRNARIESFTPAFKALVKRGYTVVRLGDPTMTPVDLPGVVDLATSPARNPWLDIWCTMRSEFLIGCDSGPSWLAVLLGVPVLTVNAVHFRDLTRPTDRIICKLARDRTTGETLSVAEMLTPEFLREGFKGDRYECIDNTPSDLRRAAIDMVDVVHGREQRSSRQQQFARQLRQASRQELGGRSALEGVAIMGHGRGTLAQTFARAHYLRPAKPEPTRVGAGTLER